MNIKNDIIVGDTNINILSENDLRDEYINNFFEHMYLPGIRSIIHPKSIEENKRSFIDHFFIKSDRNYLLSNDWIE